MSNAMLKSVGDGSCATLGIFLPAAKPTSIALSTTRASRLVEEALLFMHSSAPEKPQNNLLESLRLIQMSATTEKNVCDEHS